MKMNTRLNNREGIFVLIIIVLLGVIVYTYYPQWTAQNVVPTPAPTAHITVSTPTLGQQICSNGTISITWQVPSDMESVDIYLVHGNTSYPIKMGALANPVNGKGGSPYTYRLSGSNSSDDNYKVEVDGNYTTGRLVASSPFFSVVRCDGSGRPLTNPPTGVL